MNVLETIRLKFWSYRLLVKCKRNKLYCMMEREKGRVREREREKRERDIEKEKERKRRFLL